MLERFACAGSVALALALLSREVFGGSALVREAG